MDTTRKEDNEVNQIGILPSFEADPIPVGKIPDRGTQIALSDDADNNTVILHTVTPGKTLYLSHYSISILANNPVALIGSLFVRNGADVHQYYIFRSHVWEDFGVATTGSLLPPLEIPAGWDVCLISSAVGCHVRVFIHGYEM